ncbi:Uncharacterised protein [Shigella sonnei]|nr:Uncharacterised protein [Shigella sonnei]
MAVVIQFRKRHTQLKISLGYSSCWNFFAIRTRPGIHRHADVFMLDFHESPPWLEGGL